MTIGGSSVRMDSIVKRFGSFVAVADFTLEVQAGEFLTLLGPSGSGKTTLLSMVAGFERPSEGTIEIDGRRVDDIPPERRNVGMVFQSYALFPHMTVAQNIAFPLRLRGVPRREIETRVREVLELVRLPEQAQKSPQQLSGGQQQRVAVARALVYEPSVLLMDEPLGALDRRLRDVVQLELIQLHHQVTTTIIYVTHDQDEAIRMSDRIAVMRDSRLIQVGTPREIYERPADLFVASFVGESSSVTGTVIDVADGLCTIRVSEDLVLRGRCGARVRVGDPGVLLIRPEKLHLTTEAVDDAIPVAVKDRLYLGEATRYRVQAAGGGPEFLVATPNRSDQPIRSTGEALFIRWSPTDAIVLA
jgi:putative spermidine/putrescine transport system ATP-binding protein